MKNPKFRIILCELVVSSFSGEKESVFYLQWKKGFRWHTLSGYHRGSDGKYSYQYIQTGNPYYHIKHSIPDVIREMEQPTLSKTDVLIARSSRPKFKSKIVKVVDLEAATKQLKEFLSTNSGPGIIPPGGVPYES